MVVLVVLVVALFAFALGGGASLVCALGICVMALSMLVCCIISSAFAILVLTSSNVALRHGILSGGVGCVDGGGI